MNVSAFQLLEPSRANLDLAISGINPVPNHKMISQPILHTALPMGSVIYRGIAVLDGTMMADDPTPTIRLYGERFGLLANIPREQYCVGGTSLHSGVGTQRNSHAGRGKALDEFAAGVHLGLGGIHRNARF